MHLDIFYKKWKWRAKRDEKTCEIMNYTFWIRDSNMTNKRANPWKNREGAPHNTHFQHFYLDLLNLLSIRDQKKMTQQNHYHEHAPFKIGILRTLNAFFSGLQFSLVNIENRERKIGRWWKIKNYNFPLKTLENYNSDRLGKYCKQTKGQTFLNILRGSTRCRTGRWTKTR